MGAALWRHGDSGPASIAPSLMGVAVLAEPRWCPPVGPTPLSGWGFAVATNNDDWISRAAFVGTGHVAPGDVADLPRPAVMRHLLELRENLRCAFGYFRSNGGMQQRPLLLVPLTLALVLACSDDTTVKDRDIWPTSDRMIWSTPPSAPGTPHWSTPRTRVRIGSSDPPSLLMPRASPWFSGCGRTRLRSRSPADGAAADPSRRRPAARR